MNARLEDVTQGAPVGGVTGDAAVAAVAVHWIGWNARQLTYRTKDGRLDERLLYRDHEACVTLRQGAAAYDFPVDGIGAVLCAGPLGVHGSSGYRPCSPACAR